MVILEELQACTDRIMSEKKTLDIGTRFITGYYDSGGKDKKLLLFTPVFEGMTFVFAKQISELSRDYRVVTYFLENLDTVKVSSRIFAEDLIKFMDHLNLRNANVVTMCVTSSVPLHACFFRPELFSSFFITNAFVYYPVPKSLIMLTKLFVKFLPDKMAKSNLANFICNKEEKKLFMPFFLPLEGLGEKLSKGSVPMAETDLREEIKTISQKCLVMTTSRDPLVPVKYTKIIAESMENSEFVVVDDEACANSHFLSLSAPEYYMRRLKAFLA